MTTNQPSVVSEDGGNETPPSNSSGDDQYERQTVQIPLSACPTPPKPGGMLQFKVVSIDQNTQSVNAVCMDTPEAGGSDSLAGEFDEQEK